MNKSPLHIRNVILLTTILCGGCAYVTDGAVQDITVRTPGANNAECKLSVGSVNYMYQPPMTRSIQKSGEIMEVDCWAPGNRHKVVYIKPGIGTATAFNAPMGMAPGFAWDYTSKAIYKYPEVVDVDFTQTEVKPFPLPAQNQDDIRQPEDYDLEEFSPGLPRLNSDRFATKPEIRQRQIPTSFDLQGFGSEGEAGAEGYQFEDGDFSASGDGEAAGTTRVIGNVNEGISVPTPPPAGSSSAPASSAGDNSSSGVTFSGEDGNGAGAGESSSDSGAAGDGGGAQDLLPPEN
ncbi:MAG: hypothetical protein LRZ85_06445 [Alphaproteobacteria bacterium]|nr:hypothetical protein [Alphaproteobacteria bacterium]MCD8519962.1 hypothetical protein [Alphaproteobacteria bacterium]MCD8526398.1 hypothetical protein [Alphaproteobacteria bacterium]MCD8571542.1 hypothetical protein [Alphaproteobacteria bacterium]